MPPSVFIAVQCKQMLLVLKAYVQVCQSVCMAAVISAVAKADICHHVHILDSIISVALACVCAFTSTDVCLYMCMHTNTNTCICIKWKL